jgi:hypothetical protein
VCSEVNLPWDAIEIRFLFDLHLFVILPPLCNFMANVFADEWSDKLLTSLNGPSATRIGLPYSTRNEKINHNLASIESSTSIPSQAGSALSLRCDASRISVIRRNGHMDMRYKIEN